MKRTSLAFHIAIALGAIACSATHSLTASLRGSTSSSSSSPTSISNGPSSEPASNGGDDNLRIELKELGERMPGLAPDPGRDKAPVRPGPWCGAVKLNRNAYHTSSVAAAYEGAKSNGFLSLIKAAELSCIYTTAKVGQVASAMIEQAWINLTGLSEPDAVESITARINGDAWKADQQKLCGALTVSDETLGEDQTFMKTRQALFGCPNGYAQWGESNRPPDNLLSFLDQS